MFSYKFKIKRNLFLKIAVFFNMAMVFLVLSGCTQSGDVPLVQGLSQNGANEIMIQLANAEIKSSKQINKDGSYTVFVDQKNQITGLKILATNGQPKQNFASMGEIFKKDGLISSPLEEYARYTYAMDQDLEKTISLIDGVLDVRVHVSIPAPSDNLWNSERVKPTAAVFIKYKQGYRIDLLTNRIKLLISKAVAGLSPDMVEILPLQRKEL